MAQIRGPRASDRDPLVKLLKPVLTFIMIISFRVAFYLKTIGLGLAIAPLAINSGLETKIG